MTTPSHSSASAFPRYLAGELLADSETLRWPGLYARHFRLPRTLDRLLVPSTPEPHISCNLSGSATFRERDPGGEWITHRIRGGDLFVTRSHSPYEVELKSPPGEELETLSLHIGMEPFQAALEARYPGRGGFAEVDDFFGTDETLWHICQTCASLLTARTPGDSPVVAALTQLFAAHLVDRYTQVKSSPSVQRGGLPIRQLRVIQDHIAGNLESSISIETLAGLVGLSASHFSHVFKESTGKTPLNFITSERIGRAQQMIRGTDRPLIEIGMEVGYTSPSHFAQVFRRVVGVTPSQFRVAR